MGSKKLGLDTLALHAGQTPDKETLSRAVPIYQTTSYVFKDTDHAANLFALREFGNIYTRLMNPTTDVLEKRLAAIHGGAGAVATASGSAAVFSAIANICSQGQNFVTGDKLYGGTYTQFCFPLKRFGIEARFVDSRNPKNFEKAIDAKTRLLYSESIGNPKCNIDDIDAIAEIAHKHKLPFILDNTMSPPPIFNPFEHGVDIIVYSLTKMIGGHGTSIGGAVVEKGDFDWKGAGKFPEICEPDAAYHGVNFWDAFGNHPKAVAPGLAFVLKIRTGLLRDLGACLSPFNSFLILQGLETLPLRARQHCANAQKVAEFLEKHPLVTWVEYAGLKSHVDNKQAKKLMPLGPSAVFGFGIKGGYEAAKKFINNVKLASHLANILDAKTLVIHSASTTHQQLTPADQKKAGVLPEQVRISVGLEDAADIMADIDQALKASQ
ncbi:MAG TPA: O-acetylhomoserine aminocarboxypropyltransferase/cysteine synthase family protein [Planctomycetota bacterium]|nr:O-acetylhomoserine aminocarboxypropyltransferase/cysteine synthase family protein [Planctomycetota bacterium]